METKKAICTKIVHNTKSYNSKYGMMFCHQIEFANGDKGEYQSKDQTCTKFEELKEADYTIETKQVGQYTNIIIKTVQTNEFTPGGKFQKAGNESFALSYSKDVACANIAAGRVITSSQIIEVAESFYQWLQSKKA